MIKIACAITVFASSLVVFATLPTEKATAAGKGEICGGFVGASCDKGLFCDAPAGLCQMMLFGTCVPIRAVCALGRMGSVGNVCGCDGHTYWNDCWRIKAKVSKAHDGPC
jgi:hypothetical protein